MENIRRRLYTVGDRSSGKNQILFAMKGPFPEEYVPIVFPDYVADITIEGDGREVCFIKNN